MSGSKPTDRYILNSAGEPVAEPDLLTWARWFETHPHVRRVAIDRIGMFRVSTVFLGLDHNFDDAGPPILWETMTFIGDDSIDCDCCSGNREQALAMHQAMVERVASIPVIKE